jgi:branched-chain amino acid transport system substrate-binding protein
VASRRPNHKQAWKAKEESMKRIVAPFVALAAVSLVAACSTSNGNSSDSNASSTATGSTAAHASGSPVQIVLIDDASETLPYTDVTDALQAVVQQVNNSGGIKGHPLSWTVCQTQGNDNLGAQCARNAASNKNVVAVVGSESEAGANIDPILESAKLPNIGVFPLAPNDYSSPMSFPVTSGPNGITAGDIAFATAHVHAKKLGLAYAQVAAGAGFVSVLQPVAQADGASITASAGIPATAPDLSSYVVATAAKTDAVILGVPAETTVRYAQAESALGVKTPIFTADNLTAQLIPQLPNGGAGIYFADNFLRQGPVWDTYLKQMSAVGASSQTGSLRAINTWVAGQLFLAAAKSATSPTRAGILAAMEGMADFNLKGIIPPLNFSKDVPGQFPRLFNGTVTFDTMANGNLVSIDGKYHDVLGAGSK